MATTNLYEHNIPVYKALEKTLSEHGKAILITATGTGKSHVVLEYIQKHNLKTLVVSPRLAINRQWEEHSPLIHTITYNSFLKLTSEQVNSYGCVVFDEAHHCGSKVWGTAVKLFMDQAKIPVIGLTADSIRWMDEGKDVANELWDGHVVRGYDQAEAIQKGILPKLTYVSALFDCAGMAKSYRENNAVSDVLKRKLALTEKNCGSVVSILQKHMPEEKRKGIVFAASVAEVPEAIRLMKEAFPDCNIATAHSGLPQAVSEDAIREFTKAPTGFLVAVDMLNEGVHIHGVNTIIMLRRTGSPNLYMQQCGRGLASGGEKPIIFDFVGNSGNIKNVRIWVREGRSRTIKGYQKRVPEKVDEQAIVYDYAGEFLSVLEEIKESLRQTISWTKEEDEILRTYYLTEGLKVIDRFPERSREACRRRIFN